MIYAGLTLGTLVAIAMACYTLWDNSQLKKIDLSIEKIRALGGSAPTSNFRRLKGEHKAREAIEHYLQQDPNGQAISSALFKRHSELGDGDFILRCRAQNGFSTFAEYLAWASAVTPELHDLIPAYRDWVGSRR